MTIDVQKTTSAKRDVNIHLCERSTPLYIKARMSAVGLAAVGRRAKKNKKI